MNRIACGDAIAHPFFTADKEFVEKEMPRLPAKWPEPTPEQQFQEFNNTLEALVELEMTSGSFPFAGLSSSTSSGVSSGNTVSQPSGASCLEQSVSSQQQQQQRSIVSAGPLVQIPAQVTSARGPSGDANATTRVLQRR